jgi:AAA+ superfamily predicted ATPase
MAFCYNYNLIVIGGDPLFIGLPWRLDWLEGLARLENYDPALLRRIQRHIKFRIPDASMRRELFALHLPNPDRVQANYAVLAELSRGLSGGDILSVCVNSIHVGSTDDDPA